MSPFPTSLCASLWQDRGPETPFPPVLPQPVLSSVERAISDTPIYAVRCAWTWKGGWLAGSVLKRSSWLALTQARLRAKLPGLALSTTQRPVHVVPTHLLTSLWYQTSLATWLWSNGFYPAVLYSSFYFGTKFLEVTDHLCASALKSRERALLTAPPLSQASWVWSEMRGQRSG